MDRVDRTTLIGALAGALASGAGGYLLSDRKHGLRRRIRNAALAALAGGISGGALARIGHGYADFIRRRAAARKLPEGIAKVPGRVYFVSHPRNSIDVSKTSIPWVDNLTNKIKKVTKWSGNMPIGHAGLVTVDQDGNATRYDYGMYSSENSTDGRSGALKNYTFKVPKDISDEALAKLMQNDQSDWGDVVDVYRTDVPDIGVAERYLKGIANDKDSDSFSPLPGGYSCGSVTCDAVEAARNSLVGQILSQLTGGMPQANAPRYHTSHARYIAEH